MPIKNVCVYCGSCTKVDDLYKESAAAVGTALGQNGFNLVYGGAQAGLMGIVAQSVIKTGSKVFGIIPKHLVGKEREADGLTELIVTEDLRERKKKMEERADAIVILPGGFGTLDEGFEILTSKQIGMHNMPIIIYNFEGYWDPLLNLIHYIIEKKFAPKDNTLLFDVASTPDELIALLKKPIEPSKIDLSLKWS